jgi:isopropylmalate/homocitrate/citramalate synthase
MPPIDVAGLPGPTSAPAYQAGHHWVSAFNFAPQVEAELAFADPLLVVDSTLRKIVTTTGVRPSMSSMLEVAGELVEAGVREMILNLYWFGEPQPSQVELALVREVLGAGLDVNISVSCDALVGASSYGEGAHTIPVPEVLDTLASLGIRTIAVEGMGSRNESEDRRQARLERLSSVFEQAAAHGMKCALHLGDPGRHEFARTLEAANEGLRLGAIRLDVSDSFGSMSPEGMKLFIRSLRAGCSKSVPVTVHVHNDFGLGTATVLAAVTAGALPDVSVNGVSYRAGFAALEEVAVALQMLYGVDIGIRLDRLQRLSDLVEKAVGFPRNPMKAITGEHARLRNRPRWIIDYLEGSFPPSASCFDPALVGAQLGLVWDNNPSDAVIRVKLATMGLGAGDGRVRRARELIDAALAAKTSYPFWLDEAEIETFCREAAEQGT